MKLWHIEIEGEVNAGDLESVAVAACDEQHALAIAKAAWESKFYRDFRVHSFPDDYVGVILMAYTPAET